MEDCSLEGNAAASECVCVCVSLEAKIGGWMLTVSNINYATWCTGAYRRVCLAYPLHLAEWVSEWIERRDGGENSKANSMEDSNAVAVREKER